MGKKKAVIVVFAISIFLVFGVPLIINACYQWDNVIIITQWGASEVLSFYGTLLGAIATIAALVVTIAFTKKQIQHDRFLERNYMKWEKIESMITKILTDISPLTINDFGRLSGKVNIEMLFAILMHLRTYEITVEISLDLIKCHINSHDRQEIADFEKQLADCTRQFCEIVQELKVNVWGLMDAAIKNQDSVPVPILRQYTTEGKEVISKIHLAHEGPYQELLKKKRETFDKIYADVEQQAEEILRFKKRKKIITLTLE